MRCSTRSCAVWLIALVLLCAAPAAALQVLTMRMLASNEGGLHIPGPPELSPDGHFAALIQATAAVEVHTYDLNATGRTRVIGGDTGFLGGVSNQNQVAVASGGSAYIWNSGTLTTLPDVNRTSGISADGLAISGWHQTPGGREAVRFAGGLATGLGDLDGGVFLSEANDISPDGSTVVGRGTSGSGPEAFIFQDGVMSALGDLTGGIFSSAATAASADGSIVVGTGNSALGQEAFRWENGVMVGLGTLPGASSSQALDVSPDGRIVVGVSGTAGFVYDEANGMQSITDYLLGYGVNLTGWTLGAVTSIGLSSDGPVLAGSGSRFNPDPDLFTGCINHQCATAWAVLVPEPGTGALTAIGLAWLAANARRRSAR